MADTPLSALKRCKFHTQSFDASGLGDLYETLLNKLCGPRHGIGVDLDSRNEVGISPTMNLCRSATELDVHTPLHQVRNKLFVRIAGGNTTVRVVHLIVQCHMAGIGVNNR